MNKEKLAEKIKTFSDLDLDYNSEGGISDKVLNKAVEIAGCLFESEFWDAVPGQDDSIQIEIHAEGFDIEIDIMNADI